MEWSYSILDCLELHQEEEPHFRLFKHVLMQDVGEWVYTNEKEMIASLRADIRSICHKEKKGKRYFCEKDELLGPSREKIASRSLRRALLMPQVNTGSLYRCGKGY